jgi:hypothetical protein
MLTELLVFIKKSGGDTYVGLSVKELLNALEDVCTEANITKVDPSGSGTDTDPWVMTTVPQWLGAIAKTGGTYKIGGRLIKRNSYNNYVRDWGTGPTLTGAWHPANAHSPDGPSYGELWREIDSQKIATNVTEDQNVAKEVRQLLMGTLTTVSDKQRCLPVLTAAQFLSEPARNLSAFPIGLMLLDMVRQGVTYGSAGTKHYTWKNVLWDPHALDGTADPKGATYDLHGNSFNGAGLKAWGGKGPMNHLGSYLEQEGHERPGNTLSTVQQKEGTLLIRWLYKRIEKKGESSGLRTNKDKSLVKVKTSSTSATLPEKGKGSQGNPFMKAAQEEALGHAKALMKERIQELKLML